MDKTSSAENRVKVAEDVIKWVRSGRFAASPGTYINIFEFEREGGFSGVDGLDRIRRALGNNDTEVSTITKQVAKCGVCAKGALLLATIDRFNATTIQQLEADAECDLRYGSVMSAFDDDLSGSIAWLFEQEQLDIMEAAFEGWGPDHSKTFGHDFSGSREGFADADDRLIAVMENIVANNGVFVAEQFIELCRKSA